MANNAEDFVRAETAKAQIYTPTDARNNYELTKLVLRAEESPTRTHSTPRMSGVPLAEGAGRAL